MPTVKKAKNWMFYVMALFISGVFSLVGKHAPAWADEAKQDHNAQVFNQLYRVAQAQTTTTSTYKNNAGVRAMMPDISGVRAMMPDGDLAGIRAMMPPDANGQSVYSNPNFQATIIGIRDRVKTNQTVSLEEYSLYHEY